MPANREPSHRQKGTRSSSFGTAGRVNHDASAFYKSSLYADQPTEDPVKYIENPLPAPARNHIFTHSSENMHELPDSCVHLMVTSPPYNAGKEYDKNLKLDKYLAMLRRVWAETLRVLAPGGRACINVANLGRKPYIPLHAFIISDLLSLGFLMRGEIIWDKAASSSVSTAWGSWRSASNPTLRDVHEYILVFSKGSFGRPKPADRKNSISKEAFLQNSKSVWTFPAVSAKRIGHPAPFPQELPQRLIELYTYIGEVVLDPFMGSGQTALAALATSRAYVGYETSRSYVKLAEKRISNLAKGI
ncbi:MAG: site-specific DNA-methyltransferase [Chloroflexi bacterium]|nr:site-specific DNA-methyltransferase [Chloroflexota bacterium]